jgi:hypothetical protein
MDKEPEKDKGAESTKDKNSSLPVFSIAIIAFILSIINFIDLKGIRHDMEIINNRIESVSGTAASIVNDESAPIIAEIKRVLDKYK